MAGMSEMLLGERGQAHRNQITGWRPYSLGTVRAVRPLESTGMLKDRALVDFDLDSFDFGYAAYGPTSLVIGQRVQVYEFQVYGRHWLVDYALLPPPPERG